jgi:two-component sensor histidine kinase
MLEMVTRTRLKTLIGGKNALSGPVFTGVVVILLLFSVNYIWVISGQSLLTTMIATAGVVVLPIAVLLATRAMGGRDGWVRPHPAIVVSGLVLASLVRSCLTVLYVNWQSSDQDLDPYPIGQILSALILTVAFGMFMAALAQIALERAEAQSILLAEQGRLLRLIETADTELIRTENELRIRAHSILLPAVDEIRDLISDELSESDARLLAQRIDVAVSEVVRPLSRELALHPLMESEQIIAAVPISVNLLKDRIEISNSIRPGWLMFAFWGVLPPAGILIGVNRWVFERSFLGALISLPIIWAVKALIPRRMRDMPMALGLGVLLIVYTTLNVAFEFVVVNGRQPDNGSGLLLNNSPASIVARVVLAMFVSILAMLNVRRQQIRASLLETNMTLEKLVSRIKRETWVRRRSVSLAVHGTVQSALISTSLRLTVVDRTPEAVGDARRRLEAALAAIATRTEGEVSISHALNDLHGLWNPVVNFSSDISPAADQTLAADLGLSQSAIEICREATSNAIRHGCAGCVDIRIVTIGDLVEIRVTDDGDGPSSVVVAGLGSQMLDETCLRWQLVRGFDGGSELIAVLA